MAIKLAVTAIDCNENLGCPSAEARKKTRR
jgi:hypothetical protein